MFTLEDLKIIIKEVEAELLSNDLESDIPIQFDFITEVENIDIYLNDYLGHKHLIIEVE